MHSPEEEAKTDVTFQDISVLVENYSEILLMEADRQKAYDDAKSATQYRRDDICLKAYADGVINGGNERHKKLQEAFIVANDNAVSVLEWYEDQALKSLTLATIDRKFIEAQISLTKAWLYSRSGGKNFNG